MDHCDFFPIPTRFEAHLGGYYNGPEAKVDWTNSYSSVVGMISYLVSNTRPDISFVVHQCAQFNPNKRHPMRL